MCTPLGGAEGDSVLLLADDFFFVAHDSTMRGGHLRVVDPTPPWDALAHTVLDHLRAEPGVTSVRDWLRFLGRDAYEKVAQRLVREGHVHAREERRLLRVTMTYEPTTSTRAGWPESRLASRLSAGGALEPPDIVLAGLVTATGLDAYVLADTPPHTRPYLRRVVASLPSSLRSLVDETAAAVGDAVLNART